MPAATPPDGQDSSHRRQHLTEQGLIDVRGVIPASASTAAMASLQFVRPQRGGLPQRTDRRPTCRGDDDLRIFMWTQER